MQGSLSHPNLVSSLPSSQYATIGKKQQGLENPTNLKQTDDLPLPIVNYPHGKHAVLPI
jgi:hypothetical protein